MKRNDHSNYGTRHRVICPKCERNCAASNSERIMRHKCVPQSFAEILKDGKSTFTWVDEITKNWSKPKNRGV